jgi:hypothetical protein
MKENRCPYCQRYLTSDPRIKGRRRTCGDPLCQKALKRDNNANWRKRNPQYFQNDYERLKVWLVRHPGYLKRYRASHPDYVRRNREAQRQRDRRRRAHLDIQAKIKGQLPEITKELHRLPFLDIQDKKSPKPLEITFLFCSYPLLDIQVQIAKSIPLDQNRLIYSGGG